MILTKFQLLTHHFTLYNYILPHCSGTKTFKIIAHLRQRKVFYNKKCTSEWHYDDKKEITFRAYEKVAVVRIVSMMAYDDDVHEKYLGHSYYPQRAYKCFRK